MFTLVFSAARLGVPTGVVYFIPRQRAARPGRAAPADDHRRGPAGRRDLGRRSAWSASSGSPAGTGAGAPQRPGHDPAVPAAGVFLVSAAVNDVGVGSTRGFGVMRPLVFIDRVGRPLVCSCSASWPCWPWAGATRPRSALAWVAPYLPACVLLLLWTRSADPPDHPPLPARAAPDRPRPPRVSWRSEFGPFWRFTLPRTIGSIAQMVLQRADVDPDRARCAARSTRRSTPPRPGSSSSASSAAARSAPRSSRRSAVCWPSRTRPAPPRSTASPRSG